MEFRDGVNRMAFLHPGRSPKSERIRAYVTVAAAFL
jgi:hypothetical protein